MEANKDAVMSAKDSRAIAKAMMRTPFIKLSLEEQWSVRQKIREGNIKTYREFRREITS